MNPDVRRGVVTTLSGLSDDFAQPLDFLSAGIIRRGDTLKGETTLNLMERIHKSPAVGTEFRERILPAELKLDRGEIDEEIFRVLRQEAESTAKTGALRGTIERFSLQKYVEAAQADLKELREQILPAILKAPKVPKNVMQITPQGIAEIDEIQAARTALMHRAEDAEQATRQIMADAERLGADNKTLKALDEVDDGIVKARSRLVAAEDETNRELVELAGEYQRERVKIGTKAQEAFDELDSRVLGMGKYPVPDTKALRDRNYGRALIFSEEGEDRFNQMRMLRDVMKNVEPTGKVAPEAAMDAMRLNPFDDPRVPTSDLMNSFIREAVNDPFRGNIGPSRGFFDYGA